MKLALVLAALMLSPAALAKDLCKKVPVQSDTFGETYRGRIFYVGFGAYLAVGVVEIGEQPLLRTLWVRRGAVDEIAPPGTPGVVALTDGTLIELSSTAEATPVANANEAGVFTQWAIDYPLTDEDLKVLSGAPIKALKTEFAGSPLAFEVPEKKGLKVQTNARCIAGWRAERQQ